MTDPETTALVDLDGRAVGRGTFEPGWHWSTAISAALSAAPS